MHAKAPRRVVTGAMRDSVSGLATVPLIGVKANGFERKRWNDGKKKRLGNADEKMSVDGRTV